MVLYKDRAAAGRALRELLPPASALAPPGVDLSPVPVVRHDSGLPVDWPQRSVFMEILVRAYQDSDSNGIGDLNGLTARLDYLRRLGIRALS